MLWLRIVSALVGIPFLIYLINIGGLWLASALLLLIFIGTYEFNTMMHKKGFKTYLLPLIVGEIFFIMGGLHNWSFWFSLGLGLNLIVFLLLFVFKFPQIQIKDVAINIVALIYVGWSLSHILLLANLDKGNYLLFFLFVVIWSTDTGAYFSGRFFGKRKLASTISPNKTVEGAIGGLVLSVLIGIIFNNYFKLFTPVSTVFISILISIMGQIGDLIESAFKRLSGVKDSGNIIPGHGGVLDRFDSIIMTAPILFYIVLLIAKMR